MTPDQQARVMAAARSWIGTPFHDNGEVKGAGVDCARLLALVYWEAGIIERQVIPTYSPQWMLHRDEPLFESYVRRFAHQVEKPAIGDIVLYRVGRSFAHGAIVSSPWPGTVIHAFKSYRRVCETPWDDADMRRRETRFFTVG